MKGCNLFSQKCDVLGASNGFCFDEDDSHRVTLKNTYGKYSRCQSKVAKSGYSKNDIQYEARCFPVLQFHRSIIIDIQGQIALCPTDGSAGNADMGGVSGFSGSILPKADAFCKDPNAATVSPSPTAPPGQTPAPAPVVRPPAE